MDNRICVWSNGLGHYWCYYSDAKYHIEKWGYGYDVLSGDEPFGYEVKEKGTYLD